MLNNLSDRKLSYLIYLLGLLVQLIYFKGYMYQPNDLMVAFGGDPLVIYTDMINHICNGEGVLLDFMNYPYGESIFMTDMQASLTLVLSWIHHNVTDICDLVPGFIHGFIMILMPLTGVFLFKIFRNFGTTLWMSIVFSLLLAYLSPQLFRFRGQLSLVYPFLVPLSIYWFVDLYDRAKPSWKDIGYGFVLFFFMMNNAYTGLLACTSLLGGGLILLLFKEWKKSVRALLAGLVPLLLGYVIIQMTDPFDDRLQLQWGTFYYNLDLQSLFYPNGSFMHEFVSKFRTLENFTVGKRVNMGLGTILTWTILASTGIYLLITKKKFLPTDRKLAAVAGAGLLALAYAMNGNLVPGIQDFVETYLKDLMMFKAAGRLGWVTYYAMGLVGVVLVDRYARKYDSLRWLNILMIVVAVIFATETHAYLYKTFKKSFYENHFNSPQIDKELAVIDFSKYETIYTIPPLQTWNDKIDLPRPWATQYSALILSMNTGIPLLNAQLSRAPVNSATSGAAIASNPVLPKPRLQDLKGDKPILLVSGWKHEPTEGQQYLLDNSKYVGKFLRSSLYEMSPNLKSRTPQLPDSSAAYVHESFDDVQSENVMLGGGAKSMAKGTQTIATYNNLPFEVGDAINLSLWYHLSIETYHSPTIIINHAGKSTTLSNKQGKDFYKDWRRHKAEIRYKGGPLSIESTCKVSFDIDELHIQAVGDTTYLKNADGVLVYNSFPTE